MIAHNRPSLGAREAEAAQRVIASGWVAQGAEVAAFEDELCAYFSLPAGSAVAVSSGSAALFLALWALQARGQRVGVPVYSCASLRNAVGLAGAMPVYLDSSADHPNVACPTTALDILIAPSIFGEPVALAPLRPYRLIEDLAQALGAQVGGEKIGLRGDLGVCSFYATKLITSGGQGGAVISRDSALIAAIRDYRQFDCREDAKLRFNFQMTDLQAAIGRVQLSRLPEFLQQRAERLSLYRRHGLPLLGGGAGQSHPAPYRAVVRVARPQGLIDALEAESIRAIVPVTEAELLDDPARYPHARSFARGLVSLPLYPSLSLEHAERVALLTCRALEQEALPG